MMRRLGSVTIAIVLTAQSAFATEIELAQSQIKNLGIELATPQPAKGDHSGIEQLTNTVVDKS